MSVGGGLDALQFFWSLKKGTRTFQTSKVGFSDTLNLMVSFSLRFYDF